MEDQTGQRILFIINPAAGARRTDWPEVIRNYFTKLKDTAELFELPESCKPELITGLIRSVRPDRVIAVGGDGTLNFVAGSMLGMEIPLGILPAGSANGLAKELGIPLDSVRSLDIALNGIPKKIHVLKINERLSLHLSDLGFNAYVVKKFKSFRKRGMWSYVKAAWQVMKYQLRIRVRIRTDTKEFSRNAIMVVIANGTTYGSGGIINPMGKLEDDVFEVIVVKRVSFIHCFRMLVLHKPYDPKNTETFQTRSLSISSYGRTHFQVDGEYIGRVDKVEAQIIPEALKIIVEEVKEKGPDES
jgi:diacylglycerol kinase (ATP)